MGLAIGIGNGILFTSQRGVSSIIPGLIDDLCARATYCENKLCTTATLEEIEAIPYTAPVLPTGLLADYPGASAAYSLRNLIDTTTNVVRVRRSSDNTEQDFTSAEITDGTLTTFTGANDGFVTTWYDQSGNSVNATQATATLQPKLVTSGVVELENGKPCVKYDSTGVVKYLDFTELTNLFSVYAVGKAGGSSIERFVARPGNITLRSKEGVYDSTPDSFCWFYQGQLFVNGIDGLSPNPDISTTSQHLVVATTTPGGTVPGQSRISDNSYGGRTWRGTMQEIILYNEANNPNRTGIEDNINTEYTIYEVPVYTDNLVASYSFDTDFSDYTGNNDLTAFGSATAGVAGGKVSDCAELDGNSDYTIAADSDDFSFTNGTNDLPFSISFWANFDSYNPSPANASWIISKRDEATKEEYQVAFLNNIFAVNLFSQGGGSAYIGATLPFVPITGGTTWQHFTVTYDGSNTSNGIKMYIDGISQTTTNSVGGTYLGMINGSKPVNIGSQGWAPWDGEFDGKLDEFHIWKNRELTSAEVLDIYNTENAGNSILP